MGLLIFWLLLLRFLNPGNPLNRVTSMVLESSPKRIQQSNERKRKKEKEKEKEKRKKEKE